MSPAFLSYRHESEGHRDRVRALAVQLRDCGIEIALDQFYREKNPGGPPEGWDNWSATHAKDCGKALIIASTGYFRCFEGKESGSGGYGSALESRIFYTQLYDARWKSDRHRVILVDNFDRELIPAEIKHLSYFRPLAFSEDFEHLVGWIKGSPVSPTAGSKGIRWPQPDLQFSHGLADRQNEWPTIVNALSGHGPRILLCQAPSGSGKSGLLIQAVNYSRHLGIPVARTEFKAGLGTPDEVMDILANETPGNLLIETRRTTGPARKAAFDRDLRNLGSPLVFILDSWERIEDCAEIRDWVEHRVLPVANTAPGLVVLIGGQRIPDRTTAIWKPSASSITLSPVNEGDWRSWTNLYYPDLIQHVPTLFHLSKRGHPGDFVTLIETLRASVTPSA